MSASRGRSAPWLRLALFVAISLLFNFLVFRHGGAYLGAWGAGVWSVPTRIEVVEGDAAASRLRDPLSPLDATPPTVDPESEPEVPEEEEKRLPDGQLVETPPPTEERIPLDSDYLAEHNASVPEETRSERYRINPEVIADRWSEDAKYQMEDAVDVGATDFSTGATVGSPSDLDAGRGAPRSALPSRWSVSNKPGVAAPVQASSRTQSMSGAPQNDLLDERNGDRVALNTREFLGAEYINRIRRMVNYYWDQNVQNLPNSVVLSRSQYLTEVAVVLDGTGALETIDVTHESGLGAVDACVVNAFRIAGPFPNPPAQLISKDGRVYLDDLGFTLQVGRAHLEYQGIDPRAGVQFPGILKSPR